MRTSFLNLICSCCLLFSACTGSDKNQLFQLVKDTGISFRNDVEDGSNDNSFLFRNFYNGGGVGLGDINNDGLVDVFLTANSGPNKLYLNKGNFKFEDITEKAGFKDEGLWSTGVAFVDINADGFLDLYVSSSGHMKTGKRKNKLYINNKNLTFTENAAAYGLDISAYTTQVSFFDYDLDGDLDCFMINNSPIPINQLQYSNRRDLPEKEWPVAEFLKGGGDHLYRNDNGRFTEVTREAGIHGTLISFGLGVSVGDINGDHYPDVFVSNDSYERDYLYINQKNGTFKDELENLMQHTSFSSMGADIADINNDGYPDLFTTDMFPLDDYRLKTMGAFDNFDLFNAKLKAGFFYQYPVNSLQLGNKNGMFKDIARYSGVAATDWSWGALMFDMDNDGWNDIYVCNGVNRDVTNLDFMNFFANEVYHKMVLSGEKKEIDQLLKQIPRTPLVDKVYRNNGDLRFTDIATDWGFTLPTFSNGAAYGDLDNDGDLDLIVNNENLEASVFRNNSRELNKNNYIGFTLTGTGNNLFAIGSKVSVYAGGQLLTREMVPSRGFQSSVDYKLIIGLGQIAKIDSLKIIWPNRTETTIKEPAINSVQHYQQSKLAGIPSVLTGEDEQPIFTSVPTDFQKHQENGVTDFYNERNILRTLANEGPRAAVGDLNSDGLDDIIICGTTKQPTQVYLQTANGKFLIKDQPAFKQFLDFEDVAIELFDADNDKDLDLLLCPGGNSVTANSRELQLRFFRNDGKGNFALDVSAIPNTGMNIGVAVANDFNQDGFVDLFVGGRSFPGIYGLDPRSYLLINDGTGHFRDIAPQADNQLAKAGMVCDAIWADLTGDAAKELVIVGEWMSPKIYSFEKNHVKEVKTNLGDLSGWWQTAAVADLNGDGRLDLVLGNVGKNFYLNPSKEHPVKLWIHDFDHNNSLEKILTYTVNGKDMPVFLKKDMEDQIPSIKKENLRHEVYATKSIDELFTGNSLQNATIKKVNYSSSCIAFNQGNGNFTIQELPVMCQLSTVNSIYPADVNGDGYTDLVLAGNQFGFLPQFERLDASFGEVLINDGKGGFKWQDNIKSGLMTRGQVRDIVELKIGGKSNLLFLQNNDVPVMYKLNR